MGITESLDQVTENAYQLCVVNSMPVSQRLFRGSIFTVLAGITSFLRPFVTEHFEVEGFDAVIRGEHTLRPPYLLLAQHNTWNDIINLPPLWFSFPQGHHFTGPTRTNYFPEHPRLNAFIDAMTRTLFFHVYRTAVDGRESLGEVQRMQEANKRTRDDVLKLYQQRINIALAPEGTTKGNGRISSLRSGAYYYSHFETPEGDYVVPCVPFGMTYDFLSGSGKEGKRKHRVFARVGQPFFYAPVLKEEGEDSDTYKQRDKVAFNQQIYDAFIDLNTITAAQLGAVLFYDKLARGERSMTFGGFFPALCATVDTLKEIDGVRFDPALLDQERRHELIYRLYGALLQEGYLVHNNGNETLCQHRALQEPASLERYKQENILLYTYNKIAEVMEQRPAIRDVIKKMC